MQVPVARNQLHTLVGASVLLLVLLVAVLGYRGGFDAGGDHYPLHARFGMAEGIRPGSPVLFLGVPVGHVRTLALDPADNSVILTLDIAPDIAFPRDSAAKILSTGIDGRKYVKISPGGAFDMMAPGERIEFTQDSVNVVELLERVITGAEAARRTPAEPAAQDL